MFIHRSGFNSWFDILDWLTPKAKEPEEREIKKKRGIEKERV